MTFALSCVPANLPGTLQVSLNGLCLFIPQTQALHPFGVPVNPLPGWAGGFSEILRVKVVLSLLSLSGLPPPGALQSASVPLSLVLKGRLC
jgi:hypothetical protein